MKRLGSALLLGVTMCVIGCEPAATPPPVVTTPPPAPVDKSPNAKDTAAPAPSSTKAL